MFLQHPPGGQDETRIAGQEKAAPKERITRARIFKISEGECHLKLSCESKRFKSSIFGASASRQRQRSGMTLIEAMLAVLILTIVVVGISTSFVSGRRFVVSQQNYQAAAQLAIEKFEEIKTIGYDDMLADDEGVKEIEEKSFTVNGQRYVRRTYIEHTVKPSSELPKPCKKVTVIINWTLNGTHPHQSKLVTYIGP